MRRFSHARRVYTGRTTLPEPTFLMLRKYSHSMRHLFLSFPCSSTLSPLITPDPSGSGLPRLIPALWYDHHVTVHSRTAHLHQMQRVQCRTLKRDSSRQQHLNGEAVYCGSNIAVGKTCGSSGTVAHDTGTIRLGKGRECGMLSEVVVRGTSVGMRLAVLCGACGTIHTPSTVLFLGGFRLLG